MNRRNRHRHSYWGEISFSLAVLFVTALCIFVLSVLESDPAWQKIPPVAVTPQPDPNFVKEHLGTGEITYYWPQKHCGEGIPPLVFEKLPPDVTVQGDTLEVMPNGSSNGSNVAPKSKSRVTSSLGRSCQAQVVNSVSPTTEAILDNHRPSWSKCRLRVKDRDRSSLSSRHMLSSSRSWYGSPSILSTEAWKTAEENSETMEK